MKRTFAFLMLLGFLTLGNSWTAIAQEEMTNEDATEAVDSSAVAEEDSTATEPAPVEVAPVAPVEEVEMAEEEPGFHQQVKTKFIEGGWQFMGAVLLCLILGLSIAIERIITLNLATTNTDKLLANLEKALTEEGVEAAKEVTKNTKGPIASIFTQGLMRLDEGIEMVEKSIISYGSVEMGRLEKGLVWVSLFISLAPMLGFMGTVIGMIGAFDAIQAAGDISPTVVAGGIKVALLTTVAGLIVGVILQVFYNYLVSKIDSLVNTMEDSSISFVDLLVHYNQTKK
ncbi:MAG: MotA/TolQ/ExbB proton channel family protein [Cyclobacteriaceae bacterium]|nr:MotA/TolQ/ExbB proton channel family protein [Cyclobacteriaceae bacterium]